MGKFALWFILVIGLAPWVAVCLATARALLFMPRAYPRRYGSEAFLHDAYVRFSLWPFDVTLVPRIWALALLVGGILSLVIGLAGMLYSGHESPDRDGVVASSGE